MTLKRNDATQAQVQAARPHVSTWLSANAGSGKTRVLTDRVARLLLSKVPPERILCLTYTKAAASEMQNRLFKRLGAWAMLDDDALRQELRELGEEGAIGDADLRIARTLFAGAIEAPGGLKIQTIHSFCSSILRRFPMEAGVSPQFTEMEDRASELLRQEIIEDMAQGDHAALMMEFAQQVGLSSFDDVTQEIVSNRAKMAIHVDEAVLFETYGAKPEQTRASLAHDLFDPATKVFWGEFLDGMSNLTPMYQQQGDKLRAIDVNAIHDTTLDTLASVFLDSKGELKIGKIPQANHKRARDAMAPLLPQIDDMIERFASALDIVRANDAARSTLALNAFARVFINKYETRKAQAGMLDFDDLILKTRDLLNDPRVAQWVLYRLDGGIDHILVDEAQDTSPEQWEVIQRLSEDFTSGLGARSDVPRTLFVVGDKKQSIYSFQGADPRAFDAMFDTFDERLKETNTPLVPAQLHYSFRSSQCILELVDSSFTSHESAGFSEAAGHIAFENGPPGRVDIWPHIEPVKGSGSKKDLGELTDTVDKLKSDDPKVTLAQRIASEIKHMIRHEGIWDSKTKVFRRVRAGDILILVQRRSELFHEIIRACKEQRLPIAGADRLKVGGEMAVRDLQALLSFLATPEDDYALAVVLKSPLFGWSEKQLFDLAHGRGKKLLWQQLREQAAAHPDVMDIISDLQANADFLRPYDLIERVLTRHEGRQKFLGRLGHEAEDGIDALLAQALSFERSRIPSLTGFLTWMETDDLTIKRQMGQDRDEIRVMTVHGSKGLEAPIVIMPETQKRRASHQSKLLDMGDFIGMNVANSVAPTAVLTAKETQAERDNEERMRLLYVAMTRAEKWLILAAAGDIGKDPEDSWYEQVRCAALTRPAQEYEFSFGQGWRIEPQPWSPPEDIETVSKQAKPVDLDAFFQADAPGPQLASPIITPSELGGAKALPSKDALDEDAAKLRGTRVHMMLEHLAATAREDWPNIRARVLGDAPDADEIAQEAEQVLDAPHLAFVFAAGSLPEVAVTSTLWDTPMSGVIDRLIVSQTEVWAIDFKSNAGIPDGPDACPEAILRQMGAYADALAQIYPAQTIRTAIIWTRTASLMELPATLTSAALHRAHIAHSLDGQGGGT